MNEKELLTALEESERRFREVFEINSAVKLVIEPETGAILDANAAACRFYGWDRATLLAKRIQDINTMPPEHIEEEMERARTERRLHFRFQHRVATGEHRDVDVYSGPVTIGGRTLLHSIIVDQTERRALEREVLEAQRMQLVGKLAGGVAHDFNNLLAILLSTAEVGRRSVEAEHPAAKRFDDIISVAWRARDVTGRLLTLAKNQLEQPRNVRIDEVVAVLHPLLAGLVGGRVEMVVETSPGCTLLIDPGQLEQVIMNLAVNARDAMPSGGTLTIRTSPVVLDGAEATARGVAPGAWVELRVADTGMGMPPDVARRAFEPFFTTKDPQFGTGLGLWICRTIVESAGGHISVDTTPGSGSAFSVLFPHAPLAPAAAAMVTPPVQAPAGGSETILVVDDERTLRGLVAEELRAHGYTVLEAEDGAAALRSVETHQGPMHLVVSDVVMVKMSGVELARRLRRAQPQLPVLLMSGYSAGLVGDDVLDDRTSFLAKPFRNSDLLRAVRELLDGHRERELEQGPHLRAPHAAG